MQTRHCQRLGWFGLIGVSLVAAMAVLRAAAPAYADDTKPITVNIIPGTTKATDVGCGFGDLSLDRYELKIQLEPQAQIANSGVDEEASDGTLWAQDGDVTKYKMAGVTPNNRFWVVIWAKLKGAGGQEQTYWMSVSDVDVDADTDNNATDNPRTPSERSFEDFEEYPGYQSPATVPGLVLGVNDDHDEFLDQDPPPETWGRDYDDTEADLEKEGKNYGDQSIGLAQIKVKVGVKRAPGQLTFSVPSSVQLFEGEQPVPEKKGKTFEGDRSIDSPGKKTFIFYAEGTRPENDCTELEVTYTPQDGQGAAVDTVRILPVRMDIDVDSDNSGTLDGNDEAEDLLDAKPGEPGMLVWVADNPNDRTAAESGLLHGLDSGQVTYLLEDHNPVITLKKLSGSTADVRVWKCRQYQNPVLMLDTSVEDGSTNRDGEGGSLFDLLGDNCPHWVEITGLSAGEVLLGLELTVNGAKVAMDVVRITIEPQTWKLTQIGFGDAGQDHGGDNEHPIHYNGIDAGGWGDGAEIEDPVWINDGPDPDSEPDKNEPVCYVRSFGDPQRAQLSYLKVDVSIELPPVGGTFTLVGMDGATEYFRKEGLQACFGNQVVSMVASDYVLNKIDKLEKTFAWRVIRDVSGKTYDLASSTHTIYVILASPILEVEGQNNRLTRKRLEFSIVEANTKGLGDDDLDEFLTIGDRLVSKVADMTGDSYGPMTENPRWLFYNKPGDRDLDCHHRAALAANAFGILGVRAYVHKVFATCENVPPAPPGYAANSSMNDYVSNYIGAETSKKKYRLSGGDIHQLKFEGNNFEGCLRVEDGSAGDGNVWWTVWEEGRHETARELLDWYHGLHPQAWQELDYDHVEDCPPPINLLNDRPTILGGPP